MVLTQYKSPKEIKHSLGDAKKVVIFSCSGCANMNEIGGRVGLRFMTEQLTKWGYDIVAGAVPTGLCSCDVMKNAVNKWIKPNKSKTDALLSICCGAGMKNSFYFNPGLRVVAGADPMGVETLLPHGEYYDDHGDDLVAYGLCVPCGHCVLSFTTGICPLVECTRQSKYGFCENPPKEGNRCSADPDRKCVWKIIEQRGGNIEDLEGLKKIHENSKNNRIPSIQRKPSNRVEHSIVGYSGGRLPGALADMVHWIR